MYALARQLPPVALASVNDIDMAYYVFARGQGWTYRPYDRTLIVSGDVAWFDEKLDNDSYGALRGSGLLRRSGPEGVWKIEQYVLSFTVPNDRARAVVALIKSDAAH
jgi:hypothetical protein